MVKHRNPAVSVLLAIVTLGIYGIVASYLMGKEADEAAGAGAKRPMGAAIIMQIIAILTFVSLPIVMLVVLAGSLGALVMDGAAAAEGAATTGLGIILVLLFTYLALVLGAGILYTGGHARIQQATKGSGGAAWGLGITAVVLNIGSAAYLFEAVPDWVMFIGLGAAALMLTVFAMSASALNSLAPADAGAAPGADAAAW